MKMHTRWFVLSAVLVGTAFLSAQAASNVPKSGELPDGGGATTIKYREVGSLTYAITMGKQRSGTSTPKIHHRDVMWKSFADFEKVGPNYIPRKRTTAWHVGGFDLKPNGQGSYESNNWPLGAGGVAIAVDLHEIGAQHRGADVLLRVVTKTPGAATVHLVEKDGTLSAPAPANELRPLQNDPIYGPLANGFYLIRKSAPQLVGVDHYYDNRYVILSTDKNTTLELYFPKHTPGEEAAQTEDGGPPPIPPGNEN